MLKNLFASVGIGSAKLDARVLGGTLVPGGDLAGEISIRGGSATQEIRGVSLRIVTDFEDEVGDDTVRVPVVLSEFRIPEQITVAPGETLTLPFTLDVPYETPVTVGRQRVFLKSGLDIQKAIDASDKDELTISPTPLMQGVLDGMERLGFRLHRANCEKDRHLGRGVPFVQEFEFKPTDGFYRSRVDEIDVMFMPKAGGVDILLEVDRKARGLSGFFESAMNRDDRYVRLSATDADLGRSADAWATLLKAAIDPHLP